MASLINFFWIPWKIYRDSDYDFWGVAWEKPLNYFRRRFCIRSMGRSHAPCLMPIFLFLLLLPLILNPNVFRGGSKVEVSLISAIPIPLLTPLSSGLNMWGQHRAKGLEHF
jgi:hypothetical protein